MNPPVLGALTTADADYRRLKAKGRSRVTVTADQIVTLLDWLMDRDKQILELRQKLADPPA